MGRIKIVRLAAFATLRELFPLLVAALPRWGFGDYFTSTTRLRRFFHSEDRATLSLA
jgi:hypothetical protein